MTHHVSELLSAYLDDQVTLPERHQVEEHLLACEACRAELLELRMLTGMLRRLPAQQPPRSFAVGPRAARPEALSGTIGGYLRVVSSIAAALAVVAVGLSLVFQGLPRQTATVAAPPAAQVGASAPAPQAGAAPARAAQPAGAVAEASRPAAVAAKPGPNAAASAPAPSLASGAPKPPSPAPPLAPASPGAPAPGPQTPALGASRPVDVPRLAGELLILVVALALAVYSLRWWRP